MTRSGIEAAKLSVMLDVRYPHAYLALQPAADLGRDLGIEINWLPVVVPPLHAPSTPGPDDDRGIRHRRARARAIAREIETYAASRGLVLREYYRAPDPSALNLGWLFLRERHPSELLAFLGEAFRAYWAVELDPGDESAIADLVATRGGDAAAFRAWCRGEGPTAASELAEELRERGVPFGVPGYLLGDEFFHGRQHLPMIRWILEGRRGPGPI